jgi:hypothetical protein
MRYLQFLLVWYVSRLSNEHEILVPALPFLTLVIPTTVNMDPSYSSEVDLVTTESGEC